MKPGKPRILTCPFCGTEKLVLSLISGNTIGAEYWSDGKKIAPMLPETSYVQKCPHCGKYYITSRQEPRFASVWGFGEQGLLTFPEMKEAFDQISKEGFEDANEEETLHFMLLYAYNDYYYRSEEGKTVDENDHILFVNNVKWILENCELDDITKAEFYREIGDMANAKKLAESLGTGNMFYNNYVECLNARIEQNDCIAFKINYLD